MNRATTALAELIEVFSNDGRTRMDALSALESLDVLRELLERGSAVGVAPDVQDALAEADVHHEQSYQAGYEAAWDEIRERLFDAALDASEVDGVLQP